MQFTWNIAQGVSSYNKQTGFGFVIGAVYNANAALRIPETNSSFLPQWWYAGTAICDVTCTEYGVQATAPMQYGQRTWNAAACRCGSG